MFDKIKIGDNMKRNKKQRRIMFLLILILGVTIGFALLSTTLFINGTANIKSNTWNIHWDDRSVNVTTGSVSATEPSVSTTTSTKDTVSFDVELEVPGDYFEFEIDAINEGSVDGELELAENWITYKSNNVETTLPDYMDFKVTYDDDTIPTTGNVLKASESKTYKIRVEYKSSVEELPSNPPIITIEVNLPYVQHKETQTSPIILPTGKTKDNLEVGDIIKIKNEEFNFIRYDNEDIVMLAKYNLKVGGIYTGAGNSDEQFTKIGEYTPQDEGYGLQSSEARGCITEDTSYGLVPFSANMYWEVGGTPKSDYPGGYYPNVPLLAVYDPINYKGAPGTSNYSVAYYVEQYKDILNSYDGVTVKEARLLKHEEANNDEVGCHGSPAGSCSTTSFIANTSFWLQSCYSSGYVGFVFNNKKNNNVTFAAEQYNRAAWLGVRPVIVISKSTV